MGSWSQEEWWVEIQISEETSRICELSSFEKKAVAPVLVLWRRGENPQRKAIESQLDQNRVLFASAGSPFSVWEFKKKTLIVAELNEEVYNDPSDGHMERSPMEMGAIDWKDGFTDVTQVHWHCAPW